MSEEEITAKFSVAELSSTWDQNADPADSYAVLLIGARTDLGCVRENNEDKFEFYIPRSGGVLARRGLLLAVADGMGGHAAGQIASELGLKTLVSSYFAQTHSDIRGGLRAAIEQANAVVHSAASIPGRSGMGSTLTSAVVRGRELVVGHVGDSRLYLFSGGAMELVSDDHSLVNEHVKMGLLTDEEAETSPFKNVITRSLGTQPKVEVDIYERQINEGDSILLCSDGLSGVVKASEMADLLRGRGPAESAHKLVDLALARGGPDNITVVIAEVREILAIEDTSDEMEEAGEPDPSELSDGEVLAEADEKPQRRRGLFRRR